MTVICEGQSERELREFLNQGLQRRRVPAMVRVIDKVGNRHLLKDLDRDIQIAARTGELPAFVVLDLFKNPFRAHSPEALRISILEALDIGYRESVRPHVFVHELEALYFADPQLMEDAINLKLPHQWIANPEEVNSAVSPFKQLADLCQRTPRVPTPSKTILAKAILPRLDAEKVALKCPNFRLFWDDLLQEASS